MALPDHAGSVTRSGAHAASSTSAANAAAALDAGNISARLDRLPATRSIWKRVVLLSLGFFFELYDLLYSGYIAPGLVKSGLLTATTRGLFGSTGVASFRSIQRAFYRHDCVWFSFTVGLLGRKNRIFNSSMFSEKSGLLILQREIWCYVAPHF